MENVNVIDEYLEFKKRTISEKTHTKCRVKIEHISQDYYDFLVPNHLVDKDGEIDERIKELISVRVERSRIDFSECNRGGELDDYTSQEVLDFELTGDYFDPETDYKQPVYDTDVEWTDLV